MTDKQSFLARLKAALEVRGISESDIAPYIEQFDRYYDRMVSDSGDTVRALDDVEAIADNISRQVSERYDDIDKLAARTLTMDAVSTDESENDTVYDDDLYGELEPAEESDDSALVPELAAVSEADAVTYTGDAVRLPDYESREPVPNTGMFWGLFCAALPLTIPAAALGLSAFAAMWLSIIALMVVTVAALVAVAAGGAAAALIGVIYGVIQLTTSVAVGVYEIGLGVIAAGCAMLVGILLYNLAVRLLPILVKLVYRLFKYTLKQLGRLFDHLRRESAKL